MNFEFEFEQGSDCFMVTGQVAYEPAEYDDDGCPVRHTEVFTEVVVAKYDNEQDDYIDLPKAEADKWFEANKADISERITDMAADAYEQAQER